MGETYEDSNHYGMVMEFMPGGTLADLIENNDSFSENFTHRIIAPMFDAVLYCHSLNIAHRDIKPENVLLSDTNPEIATFKISDFGMARFIDTEQALATTMCGSPAYVAPEVLMQKEEKDGGYDHNCDFWSVAVIMFYLLCGTKPFDCEDNFELFEMIKEGDF
jgi:serine/threonine protein kinase